MKWGHLVHEFQSAISWSLNYQLLRVYVVK